MVGAHDELSHQSKKDELEPSGEQEDGEQEQGIAMGLHSLKEFLVKGRTTQQGPSQKREQTEAPRKDTWVWWSNFPETSP